MHDQPCQYQRKRTGDNKSNNQINRDYNISFKIFHHLIFSLRKTRSRESEAFEFSPPLRSSVSPSLKPEIPLFPHRLFLKPLLSFDPSLFPRMEVAVIILLGEKARLAIDAALDDRQRVISAIAFAPSRGRHRSPSAPAS
jgi:hypothetical protein